MYLVVWEFRVATGLQLGFLDAYGPGGEWEQLFRRDENFQRTIVSRIEVGDPYKDYVFLTLDFWNSKEAYELFKQKHAERYNDLDRACEEMTTRETFIGAFESIS